MYNITITGFKGYDDDNVVIVSINSKIVKYLYSYTDDYSTKSIDEYPVKIKMFDDKESLIKFAKELYFEKNLELIEDKENNV